MLLVPSLHIRDNFPCLSPTENEIYLPERLTHKIPGQQDTGTAEGMYAVPQTGVCMWNVRGPALASILQASDWKRLLAVT